MNKTERNAPAADAVGTPVDQRVLPLAAEGTITALHERPILFSGPMVRAILAGTKTQTRRVVKGWPLEWLESAHFTPEYVALPENYASPYGFAGDGLWVRETWGYIDPDRSGEDYDDEHETAGPGPAAYCDELLQEGNPLRDFWRRRVTYAATWQEPKYGDGPDAPKRWRPSIHMPRWASRITLEVTGVRVERLQDISEADALAEGIVETRGGFGLPDGSHYHAADPRISYWSLWDAINGSGSSERNPWVWAVAFRLRQNAKLTCPPRRVRHNRRKTR